MKLIKSRKVILSMLMLTLLSGCMDDVVEPTFEDTYENGGAYKQEIGDTSKPLMDIDKVPEEIQTDKNQVETDKSNDTVNKESPLKIISKFSLETESENFEDDIDDIEEKAHSLKGYMSSHNIAIKNDEKKINKEATITLRIPKDNVGVMIDHIKDTLFVITESSETIDITEQFDDVESKIKNLENQENQLNDLYKRAEDIDEIMKINDRLSSVVTEKESLIRINLGMKDKVSYARVDLSIKEVSEFSMVESKNDDSSVKIKKSLSRSFNKAKNAIVDLLILIGDSAHIIVLIIIGYFIYKKTFKPLADKERARELEKRKNRINDEREKQEAQENNEL